MSKSFSGKPLLFNFESLNKELYYKHDSINYIEIMHIDVKYLHHLLTIQYVKIVL